MSTLPAESSMIGNSEIRIPRFAVSSGRRKQGRPVRVPMHAAHGRRVEPAADFRPVAAISPFACSNGARAEAKTAPNLPTRELFVEQGFVEFVGIAGRDFSFRGFLGLPPGREP
jgi:hypothetical protein